MAVADGTHRRGKPMVHNGTTQHCGASRMMSSVSRVGWYPWREFVCPFGMSRSQR